MKFKLTIKNETKWGSRALRKLILRAIKAVGDTEERYSRWHVIIKYVKGKKIHGWAYYQQGYFCMKLPGPRHGPLDMKRLCQIVEHEIGHCMGLHHKEMARWWEFPVVWAEGLEAPKHAEPKKKNAAPLQERRAERARKMLAKHETVLKREQRLVKKWRQKVRYYDRALATKRAASN